MSHSFGVEVSECPRKRPLVRRSRHPRDLRSLASLRTNIDRLDQEILKLANQRARYALEIGKLKDAEGQTVYSPGREEEILERVQATSPGPLSSECVRALFRELISGSRALEKVLRVAYLGPAYTYSHLAALHRFGHSVQFVPVASISAVFEEVNRGQSEFGLVPLENSTDGRIADTLEMFTRLRVKICGEVQLSIHHCLLGRCARSEVTEVYSKPQVLSQCRNWLAKHLPGDRTVEVTSTAVAAQLAQDKPGAAAIASGQAGSELRPRRPGS